MHWTVIFRLLFTSIKLDNSQITLPHLLEQFVKGYFLGHADNGLLTLLFYGPEK